MAAKSRKSPPRKSEHPAPSSARYAATPADLPPSSRSATTAKPSQKPAEFANRPFEALKSLKVPPRPLAKPAPATTSPATSPATSHATKPDAKLALKPAPATIAAPATMAAPATPSTHRSSVHGVSGSATVVSRVANPAAPHDAAAADKAREAHAASEAEALLFASAVAGAAPLRSKAPVVVKRATPAERDTRIFNDDDEAFAELQAFVNGEIPFEIADTDEYIEGHVADIDPHVMRKLKRGEYSFQSWMTIRGDTKAEAKARVTAFVSEAHRKGERCIKIVHGRGLHSKDQVPVLKQSLVVWLTRGQLGRIVLAFTSTLPEDGGTGAIYVLLRRAV